MVNNRDLDTFSASTSYLPNALDKVGAHLFGDESLDCQGQLALRLRKPLTIILQRIWINLKKQISHSKNRLLKLKAKAIAAFSGMQVLSSINLPC